MNPHGMYHTPLKRARLPIPPPRHVLFSIKIIRVCLKTVKVPNGTIKNVFQSSLLHHNKKYSKKKGSRLTRNATSPMQEH